MKLPEQYENNMKKLLGKDYDAYINSFSQQRNFGLRANTLKILPEELTSIFSDELEAIDWCPEGFYYSRIRPGKSPYYHCGLYYIQEPSAMLPASILPINPEDQVLDICSAPGGKSTHIGAKLKGSGVLVLNDISATRCRALLKNVELAGITNACITNETPERLSHKFKNYFNKILIDAPCSGEGMFRKDDHALKAWEEFKGEKCAAMQREILYYADKMLAPGGMILYSTCTFNPVENEGQILDFLNKNEQYSLVPIDHEKYGIEKGLSLDAATGQIDLSRCGRIWPHRQKGEGHFAALLKKDDGLPTETEPMKECKNIEGFGYFEDFCIQYINKVPAGPYILHGKSLMAVPKMLPDLKGIRLIRSGYYLGDIKTKRFEPSQAFAMGLRKEDVKNTISFSINDEFLTRYLKGESFCIEAKDGWHLVCAEKYPLGWAKVKDGRLKNKYLKSWIM